MKGVRHKAMVAHESLNKRSKMFAAKSNFRSDGEVRECGVVNSAGESGFTATPMGAGIKRDTKPTIEVNGKAGAGAAGIDFHAAADRRQRSGKLAVHIRAGMKERIPDEKLHLGSLVLGCGESGKH